MQRRNQSKFSRDRAESDVFINGRFLAQPLSGVQRYAREVLKYIDREITNGHPLSTRRWRLITPPGVSVDNLSSIQQISIGKFKGHLWEQLDYARVSRRGVSLNLAGSGPVFHRKQIVVIHDAGIFRHPEHFRPAYVFLHRSLDRLLTLRSQIGTVSEFSRAELSKFLRVKPERIFIAPNGHEHLGNLEEKTAQDVAREAGIYFIVLGNLSKNKNVGVAIRAIGSLDQDVKLIVIGQPAYNIFGGTSLHSSDHVVFAGRLDDDEVSSLLTGSAALIFPSIYEGFGIPLLEAMVCGTRILASRNGASLEVAAGVADFFDCDDSKKLTELMVEVMKEDCDVRSARVRAGRLRAGEYSWKSAATSILNQIADL